MRSIQVVADDDAGLILGLGPEPLVPHTEIVRAALSVTIDPAGGCALASLGVLDLRVAAPVLRALIGVDAVESLSGWSRELLFSHRDFGRRELTVEWNDTVARTLSRRAELDWLDRLSPCDLSRAALQLERGLSALDSGVEQLAELGPLDAIEGSAALTPMRQALENGTETSVVIGQVIESALRHPDWVGPPEAVEAVHQAWAAALAASRAAASTDWDAVLAEAADSAAVVLQPLSGSRDTGAVPHHVDYRLELDRFHLDRDSVIRSGAFSRVVVARWEARAGGRMTLQVRVPRPHEPGALRARIVRSDGAIGFDCPLSPHGEALLQAVFSWPQPLAVDEHIEIYSPDSDLGPDDASEHEGHLLAIRVADAVQFERLAEAGGGERLSDKVAQAWEAALQTARLQRRSAEWLARLDSRRTEPAPVRLTVAESLLGR